MILMNLFRTNFNIRDEILVELQVTKLSLNFISLQKKEYNIEKNKQ